MVERADGVFLEVDDLQAARFRGFLEFVAERERIEIVARQNGDPPDLGKLGFDELGDRLAERVVGGIEAEQVLVILVVDLFEEAVEAIIGTPYFSATELAALIAPDPNGENMKWTLSLVISRSTSCTARGVVDW